MHCYTERGGELYVAIRGSRGPSLRMSTITSLENWREASFPCGVKHCEALFTFDDQVYAFLEFFDYPDKMQVWRLNQRRHVNSQSWRFVADAPGTARNFAVLVSGDLLIIAGGVDNDAKSLNSVFVFDLSQPEGKGRWKSWPALPKSLACGKLLHHAGRVVYTGGWNCQDGISVRLSMKTYSVNPRYPTPWDEHCLSPLPLSQSGMVMLGPCAVSVGGCPAMMSPESSDAFTSFYDSLSDSSEGDDCSSLSDDADQPPSIPVAVSSGTRPDPQEDIPQRDVFYWNDIGERGDWLKLPPLQFACSEPCLLYCKGTLLCFAGKDTEGIRSPKIETLLLHF